MDQATSRLPGDSEREFDHQGVRWRALEGWRSRGGHSLCYFMVLQDGQPSAEDRSDRRGYLPPGESLSELSGERLAELLAAAAPLTATERRLRDAGGAIWLVQNSGPVWAEGGLAAGVTGVVLTRLGKQLRRIERAGDHLARLGEKDLLSLVPDADR